MSAEITFGTDGWRAIIGDDFTYQTLGRVAQGIAEYLLSRGPDPLCVVGYDCRFASEFFAQDVARVLAANGVRSLLFDRASPTQAASWTVIDERAQGAAVVTASHNPYIFNGVKYKPETGSSAPPEVVADLERYINRAGRDQPVERASADHALIQIHDPLPAYLLQVGRMVDLDSLRGAGLRVVHETMHGSGFGYISAALGGGRTTVRELHAERNPFFGGVNPEPIPQNLAPTFAALRDDTFDLCICTDGDADRLGVIDERGAFVDQLHVFALLMRYLVEVRGWRGAVVRSINMTHMADRLGEIYQLPVLEVPVGFKNIAPKMMELDAILGGEESGGFAVRGHIPERDGILVGLLFADMVLRAQKPLSLLLRELAELVGPHAYARHDIHLERDSYSARRVQILDSLNERQPTEIAGQRVDRVRTDDGIKYFLADGSWVLLRASGTEPLIRVYAEASDAEAVEARLQAMEELARLGDGR